jgi:hypothetical protein
VRRRRNAPQPTVPPHDGTGYNAPMRLSVIVVIVDGGRQLDRCLAALARQSTTVDLEVIVPWDDTITGIDDFVRRYPGFEFPPIGSVRTTHAPASHAGLHELYDHRRTFALHAATGELVAMIEDRSVPEPQWAQAAVRAHAERPNLVIGGALASGRTTLIGHADYLCDFYRYQPPLEAGPREYVSYVNICYKRDALERTKHLWREMYYDLGVHQALREQGEELWLEPDFLARQERGDGTRLATLLAERFAWGRRFAAHRLELAGGRGRLRFAVQSILVPGVLWARVMRSQPRNSAMLRAVAATPAVILIFGAWALGELTGSVSGQ